MQLFYDVRDRVAARHGDLRLSWLYELGAIPLEDAKPSGTGFLFAGARSIDDYRELIKPFPNLRDRPEDRKPLIELDQVLDSMKEAGVEVTTPRTWRIRLDDVLPKDLTFPLFTRTTRSSWKLGGQISKVRNPAELVAEMEALRRAIQWDATILAREWVDLAPAGSGVYGKIAQEVRTWIVDQVPFAWSFHYGQVMRDPAGFPPSRSDLTHLRGEAGKLAKAFRSRCVVADFARTRDKKKWIFIEAGPGSAAGTAHERVFKAVAKRLCGREAQLAGDAIGGLF